MTILERPLAVGRVMTIEALTLTFLDSANSPALAIGECFHEIRDLLCAV